MIAYYKSEVPFLHLVLFFILGISVSISQNIEPLAVYTYIFYGLCTALILLAFFYKQLKLYLKRDFTGIVIYITMFVAGLAICNQRKEIYDAKHFSKFKSQELLGTITQTPKTKGDIARFTVEVSEVISENGMKPSLGKLLVALRFDTTKNLNLDYGDLIILKSKYEETEPSYNFAEFDYRRFLAFQNIYHQTFINQKQIAVISRNNGNALIAFALKFSNQQVEKFHKYLSNKDAIAVASTLILGYRAELDPTLLSTYSKTGTMHVLSVSGMHVAIVVLLLSWILRFKKSNKRSVLIKTFIIIILVWFYALVTGLSPSVTRAALMISFILIAKARAKPVNIFNVLAISAFILLLYNPFYVVNVGFQLSYIAVGGLIYLYPKISSVYQPNNRALKYIWGAIAVSIAAQIVTAPFSLFYFHQFPVYFILSNIFILVPAVLIMYTGFAFLIFATFVPQIKIIGLLLETLITFTNAGLKFIENIPHSNVTQVWLTPIEVTFCYAIIIALVMAIKNVNALRVSFLLISFLIISLTIKEFKHIKQKNVAFFSLRKNLAVALIEGRSAVLITDLKEEESAYLFSVKPYLDSCHVNSIQFINPPLKPGAKVYRFEGKVLKITASSDISPKPSKQDWLVLSPDKKIDLQPVLSQISFDHLLIDARNRDFIIKDLKYQTLKIGVPVHILKREAALEFKF